MDLGKVNWQKQCNNPDPNVSMEHFLKIVHTLLDRHAPFKYFLKKPNIYNKPSINNWHSQINKSERQFI